MENIENWLQSWLDLFPAEVEFAGYKIKSKAKDCLTKMQKFVKDNPLFTKDVIFAATNKYLDEQKAKDWAYTKQATYFISKQGQPSLLEAYCDKLAVYQPKSTAVPVTDYVPTSDFI